MFPPTLTSPTLMAHLRALCKEIGPRPSASAKERQAAEYVQSALKRLGVADVQEQPFRSQTSMGWNLIPLVTAGVALVAIAWLGGPWGRIIAGGLLWVSCWMYRQMLLTIPTLLQPLIERGRSQNVIARIPAAQTAQRTIYLVGHLDSNKQRFLFPPAQPQIMKIEHTLVMASLLVNGGLLIVSGLWPQPLLTGIALGVGTLLGLVSLAMLFFLISDERQPHIEGANDNATAVSILLGMAEALQSQPLQTSEVVLLFTGCEEAGCVGMESYLRQFHPKREDTFWIDLEMVGTGNLCYITRHGVSRFSEYRPHPEMAALAASVARQFPELGVTGKEMLIIEEIASLRRHGYRAVCLAGYNQQGYLPNWHRLSDTLENIEPETLTRAAHYTWALMKALDVRQ